MGKFDIDRPIAELFSVEPYALRIRNVCNSHDIATIRELCLHSNWDLLHFRHLGERSIAHMEEMLGNFGLRLGMTEEDLDAYMRFETEDDKEYPYHRQTQQTESSECNALRKMFPIYHTHFPFSAKHYLFLADTASTVKFISKLIKNNTTPSRNKAS